MQFASVYQFILIVCLVAAEQPTWAYLLDELHKRGASLLRVENAGDVPRG